MRECSRSRANALANHAAFRSRCRMIKRVIERFTTLFKRKPKRGARERSVPASEHRINPELVSRSALRVCETLQKAGHRAYIVGGAVRDLLLDIAPKDFDIATDATPEQIKSHFRRAFIIGRRFKLVHVMFGQETIEVSTFRALVNVDRIIDEHGRVLSDNLYGEQNDDSARRELHHNALYYDRPRQRCSTITTASRICVRAAGMIGDPASVPRRPGAHAARGAFAAKLGFAIDEARGSPSTDGGVDRERAPRALVRR